MRHGYIPASGGLAKFAGSRPVAVPSPDKLNAAFLERTDAKAKTYRGFILGKTHGERSQMGKLMQKLYAIASRMYRGSHEREMLSTDALRRAIMDHVNATMDCCVAEICGDLEDPRNEEERVFDRAVENAPAPYGLQEGGR